jgi:thiamine pyrophosphate-dependent acetolactate synthase large subunit-like protein
MDDLSSQPAQDLIADIERPNPGTPGNAIFGSDAAAEAMRALNIPYIALNPGASYRGLHDSIVNYLGNSQPQMLLCLHEEHAVAIGQGWAKITGTPMFVAVHSNVGLMHATMAIFNAWCDRMPIILLGATGPVDAAKRRPWIDWIHTTADQGALIRNYSKWDDQPASAAAARESILRAAMIARAHPQGPVYINLDAGMQEDRITEPLPPIDPSRYMPKVASAAPEDAVKEAVALLTSGKKVVVLAGRVSRDDGAWKRRLQLVEATGAQVVGDPKQAAAFPSEHKAFAGWLGAYAAPEVSEAIATADVILSLDWNDLGGTVRTACKGGEPKGRVIQASMDYQLHNGWSMDYQGLPVVDVMLATDPDTAVEQLLKHIAVKEPAAVPAEAIPDYTVPTGMIHIDNVGVALRHLTKGQDVSLLHVSLSWNPNIWPMRHPLDFVGGDGGGGVGGGPGISVGAALALRGTGRLPITICGDGDFLMGSTSLWTAVHYRIPLMVVVANNQSFYNDELHQERVAKIRNRPPENKWIGQKMIDPGINMADIARAQGAVGIGPIEKGEDLMPALEQALKELAAGKVVVVDVRIQGGYAPANSAMARGT